MRFITLIALAIVSTGCDNVDPEINESPEYNIDSNVDAPKTTTDNVEPELTEQQECGYREYVNDKGEEIRLNIPCVSSLELARYAYESSNENYEEIRLLQQQVEELLERVRALESSCVRVGYSPI